MIIADSDMGYDGVGSSKNAIVSYILVNFISMFRKSINKIYLKNI